MFIICPEIRGAYITTQIDIDSYHDEERLFLHYCGGMLVLNFAVLDKKLLYFIAITQMKIQFIRFLALICITYDLENRLLLDHRINYIDSQYVVQI